MPNSGLRGRAGGMPPTTFTGGAANGGRPAGAPATATSLGAADPRGLRGRAPRETWPGGAHAVNGPAHAIPQTAVPRTTDYAAAPDDYVVEFDTTAALCRFTLPAAAAAGRGKRYLVRLVAGGNDLLVARTGNDLVDLTTGANLGRVPGTVAVLRSDGVAAWYVESIYRGLGQVPLHSLGDYRIHVSLTRPVASDTALTLPDYYFGQQLDARVANRIVTLPVITTAVLGQLYAFERADASTNTATIQIDAGQVGLQDIDGASAVTLDAQHDWVWLLAVYDDVSLRYCWRVVARKRANPLTALPLAAKTAAATITDRDGVVTGDATGGPFTLTLPTAVGRRGRLVVCKKLDASVNAVTVDGAGTETIDGAATVALTTQWQVVRLLSDGTNWLVL